MERLRCRTCNAVIVDTQCECGAINIAPQPGAQEQALASAADMLIFGGAAGCGKTRMLLMEPIRHIHVPGFGGVIFRRTNPEITNEGGTWDEAGKIYPFLGGESKEHKLEYRFPIAKDYCRISFRNLEHDKDVHKWQGAQIPYIGFDEVTTFSEKQFWYLVSRNRSDCGIRPYIRCTCNPIPEDDPTGGWVHTLVSWWIDPETGYPIPERSGKIRWLFRHDNTMYWNDTREDAVAEAVSLGMTERDAQDAPKSFTFIRGSIDDNPILQARDPGYRGNLLSLPLVERERLLGGNWKIRSEAGVMFRREWFDENHKDRAAMFVTLGDVKQRFTKMVMYIDKAASETGKGARTALVLMARGSDGYFYVVDCQFGRWSAHTREEKTQFYAELWTTQFPENHIEIFIERENNSGGKVDGQWSVSNLAGYDVHLDSPTADKITRANPVSAQCEAMTLKLVRGPWNKSWIDEHVAFPDARVKDLVDATSGAFAKLIGRSGPPRLTRPLLVGVDSTEQDTQDEEALEPLPVSWQGVYDEDDPGGDGDPYEIGVLSRTGMRTVTRRAERHIVVPVGGELVRVVNGVPVN